MARHRGDKEILAMYQAFKAGSTVKAIASAYGVSFQAVYRCFKTRHFPVAPMSPPAPFVMFGRRRYYRHKGNGYFVASAKPRRLLHRDMWEASNGPVPDGFIVHHLNGNKTDNRVANLGIIANGAHTSLHKTEYHASRRRPHRGTGY